MALALDATTEGIPGLRSVRVAGPEDHEIRVMPTTGVPEIRAAHHRVAALIASDHKLADVARLTGFTMGTIQKLIDNPAFKDLVLHYGAVQEERLNDLQSRTEVTSLRLLDEIDSRLEDDELRGKIPFAVLTQTAMAMLDRAGQGPVKKLDAKVAQMNFTPQTLEAIRDAARSIGEGTFPARLLPAGPNGRGSGDGGVGSSRALPEQPDTDGFGTGGD